MRMRKPHLDFLFNSNFKDQNSRLIIISGDKYQTSNFGILNKKGYSKQSITKYTFNCSNHLFNFFPFNDGQFVAKRFLGGNPFCHKRLSLKTSSPSLTDMSPDVTPGSNALLPNQPKKQKFSPQFIVDQLLYIGSYRYICIKFY